MTAPELPHFTPPCWCNGVLPHDHEHSAGVDGCGPAYLLALYRPRVGMWARLRQLVRGEEL